MRYNTRRQLISTDRRAEDRLCRCFADENIVWSTTSADNELCRAAVTSARSSTDCRNRTAWLPRCRSCSWTKRRRSRDFNSNSLVRRMLAATSSARLHNEQVAVKTYKVLINYQKMTKLQSENGTWWINADKYSHNQIMRYLVS